jgi:hypothetical protein
MLIVSESSQNCQNVAVSNQLTVDGGESIFGGDSESVDVS